MKLEQGTVTTDILTTSEVKNYLRIDESFDDTLIAQMIATARQYCEGYCNHSFVSKTYKMTVSREEIYNDEVILLKQPVTALSSVKGYLNDGTAATTLVRNTDYQYIFDSVVFLTSYYDYYEINYTAGESTALPLVKSACMKLIASMYETRTNDVIGTISAESKVSAESLLSQYNKNSYF